MATTITYDIKVNTKSINDLESELADVNSQLKKMAIGSEEFNQATIKAQKLTSQLEGVQGAVKGINFEQKLQGFQGAIELVGGSVAATVGSLALFGVESERIGEIEAKVQGAIAIAMGLREAAEGAAKVAILARQVATNLGIASTVAATEAEIANTTATNANTAAANANKAAWLTNPYVLIAAAVVALGVAIYKLTENQRNNTAEINRAIEANNQLQKQLDLNAKVISATGTDYEKYTANIAAAANKTKGLELELKKLDKGSKEYKETLDELNNSRAEQQILQAQEAQRQKDLYEGLGDFVNLSDRDLRVKEATTEETKLLAEEQKKLAVAIENANKASIKATESSLPAVKAEAEAKRDAAIAEQDAINKNIDLINSSIAKKTRLIDKDIATERKQREEARKQNLQNLINNLKKIQLENEKFGLNQFERTKIDLDAQEQLEIDALNEKLKLYKKDSKEYEAIQQTITETQQFYINQRIANSDAEYEAIVDLQQEIATTLLESQQSWTAEYSIGINEINNSYGELIDRAEEYGLDISAIVAAQTSVLASFSKKFQEQLLEGFQSVAASANATALFFEDLDNRRQAASVEAIRNTDLYLQYENRKIFFAEKEKEKLQELKTVREELDKAREYQQAQEFLATYNSIKGIKGFEDGTKKAKKAVEDLEAAEARLVKTTGDVAKTAEDEYASYFEVVRKTGRLLSGAGLGGETNLGIDKLFGITADTEAEKEVVRAAIQEIVDVYLQAFEQIQGAFTAISGFGILKSEDRIKALEQEAELAKGNATLYQQIQEQIVAESIKLEKKRKNQAIANVVIDAAQAGMAAYASSLDLPQPMAGIVLGATLAAIATQAALSIKQIKSASETDGVYEGANISAGGGGGGGMGPAFGTVAPDVYTEAPVFQTYVLSGDVTSALYADARIRARRVL